jgi:hypothetical protein
MKRIRIRNNTSAPVNLVLEPWAELLELQPQKVAELKGDFSFEAPIFVDQTFELVIQHDADGLGLSLYVPETITIQAAEQDEK